METEQGSKNSNATAVNATAVKALDDKETRKQTQIIPTSSLPRRSLSEVQPLAFIIYQNFANESAPWDSIASMLGIGTKSAGTKYLIWSAESYGIIQKEDNKKYKLTEIGRQLVAPTYSGEDKEAARKAILIPTLLSKFYTDYDKHPIPKDEFFNNILESNYQIPRDRVAEVKEIILSNAEFAGIIKHDSTNSSKILFLNLPLGDNSIDSKYESAIEISEIKNVGTVNFSNQKNLKTLEQTLFVVSPIGEDGSEQRKHANLILKHLIQPVAEKFNLKVIRADNIDKSGLITQQILEHLVNAPFCIADLSFNNPNVFYELGVRHMSQLPTVQIIRKGDKIPFDVSQGRTIIIDLSDIYTLMDKMESAKRELTDHISALVNSVNNEIADDNPIKVYLPHIKITVSKH